MRFVRSLPFVVPLLLVSCGSKQDLFIGEISTRADAGSAGVASNAGAQATGGTAANAGNATGGSTAGGSDGSGGNLGGADTGAAGVGGFSDDDCPVGEAPPPGSLVHRYSFDGTGNVAVDAVSGADGNLVGAKLDGAGNLTMSGEGAEYVDLPDGIVSSLTDVTIVTWTTWQGEAAYPRVFDFGSSDANYFTVIPKTGFEDQAKPGLGAEIKVPGFDTVTLASTAAMKNINAQVSFVLRGGVSAALYLDAVRLAVRATAITLADIDDHNNWIGRSQYASNPPYQGVYQEFRIYDAALDACQLHTLLVNGPEMP